MKPILARTTLVFTGLLISLVINLNLSQDYNTPDYIETNYAEIKNPFLDGIKNGAIAVRLFGSTIERHQFAKGNPTRFGQLGYSVDGYLKHKGWSEEKIHSWGYLLGFSQDQKRPRTK